MKSAQEEQSHPQAPKKASPGSCNNLQLSMIKWRLDYLQLNSEEYEDLPAVITLSCYFSLLFRPTPSTELLKLLSSSFLGTVLQSSSSSLHACSCYYRVLWCFPSPILWRIILDCRINSHQDWQAANSLLLSRTFTGNWGILFIYELASHVEEQEIQEHICLQIDGLMHQHKQYETLYKILNILWLHITVEDVL